MNSPLSICYVGIYPPKAPRDKVYLEGLRARGVSIAECVDSSAGFKKYFSLRKQIIAARGSVDLFFVGYLSPLVVPIAKLWGRKKVVYNALASSYEAYVLDRGMYKKSSPKAWLIWCIDFLSFRFADIILVESDAQRRYLSRVFLIPDTKLEVIFTGVDESIYHPDPFVPESNAFTVVFRGILLPATGAEYIIEAAKILRHEPIKFVIIGWGQLQKKIETLLEEYRLGNVKLITTFLEPDLLRRTMLGAHVMLGQFSENARLERTIQHKNSEALALGLPFITRDSESNREIFEDGINCLFVKPANPEDLAEKIVTLRNDVSLREKLSENAQKTFEQKCAKNVLADKLMKILYTTIHGNTENKN